MHYLCEILCCVTDNIACDEALSIQLATMKKTLLIVIITLSIGVSFYGCFNQRYRIGRGGIRSCDYAQVYIQAGHEGRSTGATGASSIYGNEIDWTPVVADEATRILQEAGIEVIRSNADRRRYSVVDIAVSIHFDGSARACGTGASVGYDDPTDEPAAIAWKNLYGNYFKHRWQQDNFTRNLSHYYNFKYTVTRDAELVLEMCDITCPEQAKWAQDNLHNLGHVVAYFCAQRIGKEHLLTKPNIF